MSRDVIHYQADKTSKLYNMKKLFMAAALLAVTFVSQAQTTVEGAKFFDNWSFGLNGGVVSPMRNYKFWDNSRGVIGINIQKDLTPVFGFGIEGEASINTSSWYDNRSGNFFDHSYIGAYGTVNLMNLFAGYTGAPRLFELAFNAGAGWLHGYCITGVPRANVWDGNSWGTKVGLNFNFNLGQDKAWTIGFKPAILWNMGAKTQYSADNLYSQSSRYNANAAVVELMAGITYHFGNSNGTHNFVLASLYDQELVDNLNGQINGLRNDLEACNSANGELSAKAKNIEAELDACRRRPAVVKEVKTNLNNVRYVFFTLGSSYIQTNQKPNLQMTADAAKTNNAKVVVEGYASPEGSKAFNERLSQRRADAVKNSLVRNYGLDASHIDAVGKGVGDIFSVPSWNRVAVMTVK